MRKTDIINYNWHMCLDLRFFGIGLIIKFVFQISIHSQMCIMKVDSCIKSFIKIMKYALG